MEALKIEILNPKALKLIRDLEEMELIRITNEPITKLQAYLEEMRKGSEPVPSLDEIAEMVEEVRSTRGETK